MAEYKLKLDISSENARLLLDYILNLSKVNSAIQIESVKEEIPNKDTQKAIEEAKSGKVNNYKDSNELFDKLGI